MKRWKKISLSILLTGLAVSLLFTVFLYASAWYYRWRANELLAAIRPLRPGTTTELEYESAVRPIVKHLGQIKVSEDGKLVDYAGAYYVANRVEWTIFLPERFITPTVEIEVVPRFDSGVLASLQIEESEAISGHPPVASVDIHSTRFRDERSELIDESNGYRAFQQSIGNTTAPSYERFVWMDERATSKERESALNFDFSCFTTLRSCMDGGKMLNPILTAPSD